MMNKIVYLSKKIHTREDIEKWEEQSFIPKSMVKINR